MLIETRAKGGNLLLNIGPKPDGEIQIEQEALLREIALWNFVNSEAIHGIRPWYISKEGNIWFTRDKNDSTVYAFIPAGKEWPYGTRKEFLFKTLKASGETRVSVLGFASELVEYKEGFDAAIVVYPTKIGLLISAVNGQRLYTNNQWPNPVVLKIENVSYRAPENIQIKSKQLDGAK
jgi:alpha-L-fucosidase